MAGVHPLEDLAPRDVVAAAISRRMAEAPGGVDDHVYLDATHMGERFYDRFPSITAACREIGIDPARDRIPVAPAAHFACGGVPAGLDGTTALPGLYAVGEVACTGVHGANRLASNSLTEGVVAGTRLGRDLAWELPDRVEPDAPTTRRARVARRGAPDRDARRDVAPRRRGARRRVAGHGGRACSTPSPARSTPPTPPSRAAWEATNLLTVASAVVAAAAGPHREPRLPPAHRLPRATRRVAEAPRRRARRRRPSWCVEDGLMFEFHPLSDDTRRRLLAGGLDPDAVAALVRMAVAEDLMGGVDVTSVATVPAEQRSVGTFGSRGTAWSPASPSPPR